MRVPRVIAVSAATAALQFATLPGWCADVTESTQVLTPPSSAFDTLSQFTELIGLLQKQYVAPSNLTAEAHTVAALRAYVRSVDPEADLLTAEENTIALTSLGDTGLAVALRGGFPTIICARDGTPGQGAGLLSGEKIVEINGNPATNARPYDVTNALRGPVGTKVKFRIADPRTGQTREVTVERAEVPPVSAPALKFLQKGVAYCRLSEFSVPAVERLHADVKRVEDERGHGLILDLRNNPGGAFEAAQVAARLFLPAKAEIGSLEYARPSFRTTFVSDDSKKFMPPVVLLVNGGTAAEAEIFTAALLDNHRARLVGSKTFGHGALFSVLPLSTGMAVSMPTAYYLRPSKKIFHRVGIEPDMTVELSPDAERSLATAGFGAFDWVNDREQVLKTDLVLAKALELLGR